MEAHALGSLGIYGHWERAERKLQAAKMKGVLGGPLRRHSLRLARLRRASRNGLHRCEVCQLRLELLQRLHLQLAHPLAGEPELAPDRLERLRLALKSEATLDDKPLPLRQPFEPAPHRLAEKRPLCLLDGVSGSRIGKGVGELAIAVPAEPLVERDRGVGAASRVADAAEAPPACLV